MSIESADPGHGHSPAAWTTVIIMLIGFVIGTVAFYLELPWVVVGAACLALIGLIVGFVMRKLGYGVGGSKIQAKEH
jgi:carbon starvation protein CstA